MEAVLTKVRTVPLYIYEVLFSVLGAWLIITKILFDLGYETYQDYDISYGDTYLVPVEPVYAYVEDFYYSKIDSGWGLDGFVDLGDYDWQFLLVFVVIALMIFLALRLFVSYLQAHKSGKPKQAGWLMEAFVKVYATPKESAVIKREISDMQCLYIESGSLREKRRIHIKGILGFFIVIIRYKTGW